MGRSRIASVRHDKIKAMITVARTPPSASITYFFSPPASLLNCIGDSRVRTAPHLESKLMPPRNTVCSFNIGRRRVISQIVDLDQG